MSDDKAVERIVDGSAWDDFCEELKSAGHQILRNAPDDPLDRAEGLRYLARVTANFLDTMTADPDPTKTVLTATRARLGLANPDYLYSRVRLRPDSRYILHGRMGDADAIAFGTFSGGVGAKGGLLRDGYIRSTALETASDGSFELAIGTEEVAGNWLPMTAKTNSLQIRQTLLEPRHQRGGDFNLERLDTAGLPPRPLDPAAFAATLDLTAAIVNGAVGQFLGWTASFAAHPNEIRVIDPELLALAQGDPDTSYNYCYWQLDAKESLVIEFEPPPCEYWNLQIGNHWFEAFDFRNRRNHVNHHDAIIDENGTVQIVVSETDPGAPNWLDTAGHTRGTLALRWIGADDVPQPRTRITGPPRS